MSIEAMKQALSKAVNSVLSPGWVMLKGEDFHALRTAIEQAEKQEPGAIPLNVDGHPEANATIAALDALASKAGIPTWSQWRRIALNTTPPAAPVQEREAWQPIASAPKDGTRILCQDEKGLVDICEWTHSSAEGDRFTSSDDRTFGSGPAYTSWMPLPQPIQSTPPAAQPAPVQEPVAWKHDCAALLQNDVELWVDRCPHCGKPRANPPAAQPAPVQEPVAIVSGYYGGQCVVLPTNPARLFNSGTAFYTTPPAAQRQWVSLTEDALKGIFNEPDLPAFVVESARAIDAWLRSKNGGQA